MDVGVLATTVVTMLHPYIGVLVKSGLSAIGKDAWVGVKDIWSMLMPKIASTPELKAAAEAWSGDPAAGDKAAAFRDQIANILRQEPELADSLERIHQSMFSGRDTNVNWSGRDTYNNNRIEGSPGAQIGPKEVQIHDTGSRPKR